MTHPGVYIVTGVVIAVAAVFAFFSANPNSHRAHSYGSSGRNRSSLPIPQPYYSPKKSPRRRRRQSPERRSSSSSGISTSSCEPADSQNRKCKYCGESPFIKVLPCNHESSACKECFIKYLKTHDTCDICTCKIDSCSPSIPSFERCFSCWKFTSLLKLLPCNHSLSLCINCFEKENKTYEVCPDCSCRIQDYEPKCNTVGLCLICDGFTKFAKFYPCGHGNFCMEHVKQYLKSENECNFCGERVWLDHRSDVCSDHRSDVCSDM